MFKLFVLAAFWAIAAARPSHLESAPLVVAAPAIATTYVQEPAYAKVGAVVKSIPTAVSHQSQSVVHSSAHVVEPIVAPVVKTTYAAASPVLKAYAAAAPLYKSYNAPLVHAAHLQAPLTYDAVAAPLSYASSYAAPSVYSSPAHYAGW